VTIPASPTTLVRQFTRTESPSESTTPPATPSPKSLSPTHTPREEDVPSQMPSNEVEQPEIQPPRAATLPRLTQRSTETLDSPPCTRSLFETSIQEHEIPPPLSYRALHAVPVPPTTLYPQRAIYATSVPPATLVRHARDRGKKETLMAIGMHARDTGGVV